MTRLGDRELALSNYYLRVAEERYPLVKLLSGDSLKDAESRRSAHLAHIREAMLTPEILSRIEAEIGLFGIEIGSGFDLAEKEWASLVASEDQFGRLLESVKRNPVLRAAKIDDPELAVAVSVICLRPEITNHLSETQEISLAFEEVYSIVTNEVIGRGFGQPLLCRDVVVAWGNGWHRARFDTQADGWDGRWIKSLLTLTCLMERAVEHALRLLSESVDRIFTPWTADPDSPGHSSVVSSYAGLLAASAAANSCDCGSHRCLNKHRLSNWSPQTPNRKAFPLRAFTAQMARGDAGPRLLNKEFQNSALYPLLRDFHGLLFHEKVEFKVCHVCGKKYEVSECRCGSSDEPLRTKHIVFENAFWVKDHKLYARRRRQLCRKCENLYALEEFSSCPLCGEGRTPNRETKVHVLQQRLDNRAVLHPDHHDVESGGGEDLDGMDRDRQVEESLAEIRADAATVIPRGGVPNTDVLLGVVALLVAETKKSGMLTAIEASEITEKAKAGTLTSQAVKHLAMRNLLGKLYLEATESADLFPELVAQLEDCVFDQNRTPEEVEEKVIIAKASILSKKGMAVGVITSAMEGQILARCKESGGLEDSFESCAGLEAVVGAAQLVLEAKNSRKLSELHAKQCLNEALRGNTSLDAIEDNSERIRAYILSALGRRIGAIEEARAWSIRDDADNGLITKGTLAHLKEQIEAVLELEHTH